MSLPLDAQYKSFSYRTPEILHHYGPQVHILSDPLALGMLARASSQGVVQPEMNNLVREMYRLLAHLVIAAEFPRHTHRAVTRMIEHTELGVWQGPTVDPGTQAVVVALARAGLLPSQVTYDFLNQVLEPSGVRQDHLSLGRVVDPLGQVTGAALGAAKIGGPVAGAYVLIPDPMGATGSTVSAVVDHYSSHIQGSANKTIAMHLIVTPEYLRHLRSHSPHVIVYALRLDRGLSPPEVLDSAPGARWDEERGLNEHHYIVPGAGGLGEVMNNAFV
jgi:uracil phosphoribosyltransferase